MIIDYSLLPKRSDLLPLSYYLDTEAHYWTLIDIVNTKFQPAFANVYPRPPYWGPPVGFGANIFTTVDIGEPPVPTQVFNINLSNEWAQGYNKWRASILSLEEAEAFNVWSQSQSRSSSSWIETQLRVAVPATVAVMAVAAGVGLYEGATATTVAQYSAAEIAASTVETTTMATSYTAAEVAAQEATQAVIASTASGSILSNVGGGFVKSIPVVGPLIDKAVDSAFVSLPQQLVNGFLKAPDKSVSDVNISEMQKDSPWKYLLIVFVPVVIAGVVIFKFFKKGGR